MTFIAADCEVCYGSEKCLICYDCKAKICRSCILEYNTENNMFGRCPACQAKLSKMNNYVTYGTRIVDHVWKKVEKYRRLIKESDFYRNHIHMSVPDDNSFVFTEEYLKKGNIEKHSHEGVIICKCGGVIENKQCLRCHAVIDKLPETEIDEETMCLINQDSKPCPNCGAVISKTMGCNHMFCIKCHTGFQWDTLEILPDEQNTNELYLTYVRNQQSNLLSLLREYNFPSASLSNRPVDYLGTKLNKMLSARENDKKFTLPLPLLDDFLNINESAFGMLLNRDLAKLEGIAVQKMFDSYMDTIFNVTSAGDDNQTLIYSVTKIYDKKADDVQTFFGRLGWLTMDSFTLSEKARASNGRDLPKKDYGKNYSELAHSATQYYKELRSYLDYDFKALPRKTITLEDVGKKIVIKRRTTTLHHQ